MKRTVLSVFLMLLVCGILPAQVTQRGRVVEQNSGGVPLSGVTVLIRGTVPVSSDGAGRFELYVPGGQDGDRVVVYDIGKTGYELVNEVDIMQWNLSSIEEFVIVMCERGKLDEARRRYYDIGRDLYYERYHQAADSLGRALEASAISAQEYEVRIAEAEQALSIAMDRLSVFSDRFARVNRDNLNDLDRRAFERLDAGDIDGAIAVYDEADLLGRFRQRRLQRDSINAARDLYRILLEQEAALLRSTGLATDSVRADSLELAIPSTN